MGSPVAVTSVSNPWSTACPDWEARLRAGQSLFPTLPLHKGEANRAVAIFDLLRLPDVPGKPLLREAAPPWARELVRCVFGAWDPVLKERHIRDFFAMVPKKSAKTTFAAAIMVTAILVNRRPRAELLLIGPTLEVADLAFRQAVGMIEADPVLAAKFHIQEHIKRITFRATGAFLKVKSFDPKVVTGSKPAAVLIDELHVIAETADADRVLGQLRGGLLPNPEAFIINITTQSERPPAGVFRSALRTARQVRDGELDLPMLPILYEFPEGVDWRNPDHWWMVTPSNGFSISVDRLLPDFRTAEASGEEELRRWASQHLNVEIGLALRSDRWAGADLWEGAADASLTLESLLERSEVVVIGVDGGGLDDLLGLAVLGRERDTRRWLLWSHAWCHSLALERRKSEAERLRDFASDGDLTIVDSLPDDLEQVADLVAKVEAAGLLAQVGLDQIGIGGIVDALDERGINGDRVMGISQGWKLAGAIKTLERKLADGTLRHARMPLMDWSVSNAKVEPRGNAVMITKQAAGSAKIDPLMAAFNAVSLMERNPEAMGQPSFWDSAEFMVESGANG